jgi:hypothetical protein
VGTGFTNHPKDKMVSLEAAERAEIQRGIAR